MFSTGSCAPFTLQNPGFRHDFKVLAFDGAEAISCLYAIRVELASERADIDLESLLSQPAFLQFGFDNEGIHGRIEDVRVGESGKRLTHYELTLMPALRYLQFSHDQRVFQNLTVERLYSGQKLLITGHSLGGAIVLILSEMLRRDPQYSPDILLYTYGAPRASDSTFINSVQPLVHHRIVNQDDPVPSLPATWMNSCARPKPMHTANGVVLTPNPVAGFALRFAQPASHRGLCLRQPCRTARVGAGEPAAPGCTPGKPRSGATGDDSSRRPGPRCSDRGNDRGHAVGAPSQLEIDSFV